MTKKLKSLNPIIGTGYKTLSMIKDGEDGNIENFPDTLPKIPRLSYKRLGVSGLEIGWEFEDKIYYTYELYGSTTKGFEASEENLMFQGLASSYFYEAKPGEKWYFKARAKNTHGRYTEFSSELVTYTVKLDNLGEYVEGGSINGALIENATINNAHIKDLHADKITAGVLDADRIGANSITANKIEANAITSEKIQANAITTDKLAANIITSSHIQSGTIESGHIKAGTIESGHIKAGAIESDHIKSNSINSNHIQANTIQSEHIQTGAITAGSGIIAEGAIGSAQISSLDAAKIEAGTIDTSKVTIQGANGHLRLKGNRMQVFQGTGNQAKERVSLGDVNGNGSVYGLRVRGADGQTILLDENGVKSEGITDGAITNDKISDDANIDGAKLNINSVVSKINEDGTETIQGTKIEVDGTTLNTKLSTITNKQTEDSERITQAQTQISANTNAIKLKVDSQTYQTDKTNMTTQMNKNTSEISAMKGEIALKVEQTDIENAKSEMEGVMDTKVDSAKAEIKVTTDAISQNVSNLSQTVSTKADGSTVSSLNSKVSSLETSVNSISGKVTSLEKTTTTLGTRVDTANTNASSALNKANSATTTANNAQNTANTNKSNITDLQGEVSTVKSNVASLEVTTSGISQKVSSVESTTATLSGKVNTANNNATNALNKANTATSTATTAKNTADSALTQANTNKGNITTLQGTVNTTNSKVATLETNLNGITQRVSSTESTTATLTTKVNNAQNTANNANTKIDNLSISDRNLVKNSDTFITSGSNTNKCTMTDDFIQLFNNNRGKKISVSLEVNATNALSTNTSGSKRIGCELYVTFTDDTYGYIGAWQQLTGTGLNLNKKRINATYTIPDKDIKSVATCGLYIQGLTSGTVKIGKPKYQISDKSSDWTPAPEDIDSAINSVDGKVTTLQGTVNTTNSKVATLETNLNGITQRVSNVETKTTTITDLAKAMAGGKILYTDPMFKKGNNGISVYNNSNNGTVVVNRIGKIAGCPTSSTHCLEVKTTGTASPYFGGFYFGTPTRENQVLITRIIAKIPTGRNISWHSNATGNGSSQKWLTSTAGTGKWEEYICQVKCGTDGSFSSTNYFAIKDGSTPTTSNPLVWHIAYATVIDITDSDESVNDLTTRMSTAESKLTKDSLTTTIGNHYTTSTDVNGIVDKKGYATTSQVQQTVNGLEVKVQQSGGYNLLYNGNFKRSFEKWTNTRATIANNLSCPQNQTGILLSGALTTTKHCVQSVNMETLKPFTVSFWQYTSSAGSDGTTNPYRASQITITYSDNTKTYHSTSTQTVFDTWELRSITIKPTKRVTNVSVELWNRDTTKSVYYTNVMLEYGSIYTEWSPNPNEIYDGITTIDKDGVTVTASNVKSKTTMSADGFKITKTDNNEDVFKVNADGTLYIKGSVTVTSGNAKDMVDRVAGWTYSGTTEINGGNIRTGTLSASKITAGTLDASKVNVTNLNASNITTGSLNANRITTGTLDASKVNVTNLNASNIKSGKLSANYIDATNLSVKGELLSGQINGIGGMKFADGAVISSCESGVAGYKGIQISAPVIKLGDKVEINRPTIFYDVTGKNDSSSKTTTWTMSSSGGLNCSTVNTTGTTTVGGTLNVRNNMINGMNNLQMGRGSVYIPIFGTNYTYDYIKGGASRIAFADSGPIHFLYNGSKSSFIAGGTVYLPHAGNVNCDHFRLGAGIMACPSSGSFHFLTASGNTSPLYAGRLYSADVLYSNEPMVISNNSAFDKINSVNVIETKNGLNLHNPISTTNNIDESPDVVKTVYNEEKDEIKTSIDYTSAISTLWKAVQELKQENDELKEIIKDIHSKL